MAYFRNARRPTAGEQPTGGSASGSSLRDEHAGSSTPSSPSGSSLNVDSDWRNILYKLGTGEDFTQLLAQLGIGGIDPKDAAVHDWNSELLKQILQYYITQEQRKYDKSLQADQRLYDSPLNQLARLMGSGISRDAAIQMLSGGAGGSAAAGVPYGQTGNQASLLPASQSYANDVQAKTAIANTVFSGIGALSGLVSLGFSIPQAIQQVNALSMQNFMSQKAMIGLQAADDVLGALQSAVDLGVLSTEDMDGFSNATDALNYINDHKDTNAFKSVFDNGSFANVYGSKLGRQMFSEAWNNVRQSKDAGTLLDQHLRQQDLQNDLAEINTASARRQYFVDFSTTMQDILKKNEEVALLWQAYRNGEIQIEINGQILDQEKYRTKAAARADVVGESQITAYKKALEVKTKQNLDGYVVEMTGQDFLNYHAFTSLLRMYQHDSVLSGRHGVEVPHKDGGHTVMEARERYVKSLNANIDAVIAGAFISEVVNSNRLAGYDGDLSPLYKFFDMWNSSGANEFVKSVGSAVPGVTFNTGDRIFNYE